MKSSKELIERNRSEIAALRDDVATLKNTVKIHEQKLSVLVTQHQGYLTIRQRFIDTYKRDVLQARPQATFHNIQAGNRAAHGGDAVTDAYLYSAGLRQDETIFMRMYDISYNQVEKMRTYSHQSKIFTS
jgi:hypothetical protein